MEEHAAFLFGLQLHGRGKWKAISALIGTRTPAQVHNHAHRFFSRNLKPVRRYRSIHDLNLLAATVVTPEVANSPKELTQVDFVLSSSVNTSPFFPSTRANFVTILPAVTSPVDELSFMIVATTATPNTSTSTPVDTLSDSPRPLGPLSFRDF